jgi:hypothetical protein
VEAGCALVGFATSQMSKRTRSARGQLSESSDAKQPTGIKKRAAEAAVDRSRSSGLPEPEADGVQYLRAKVVAPLAGHESACVDITENFNAKSGKCDAPAVLKKINQASMWMVPAEEVARHKLLYENAVREALQYLHKIENGVPKDTHDGLVEKFDSLQRPDQRRHDSLVHNDHDQTGGPGALPVQTVQWGDAADDVQKASRRSWMMTEQGKQHLRAPT